MRRTARAVSQPSHLSLGVASAAKGQATEAGKAPAESGDGAPAPTPHDAAEAKMLLKVVGVLIVVFFIVGAMMGGGSEPDRCEALWDKFKDTTYRFRTHDEFIDDCRDSEEFMRRAREIVADER
jgi:hypothetical protein